MRPAVPTARRAPLRRRLVLVVLGAATVVVATMGALSSLALRGTLVDQLDSRLLAAADRAADAPLDQPPQAPPTDAGTGGVPGAGGVDADAHPPGLTVLGQGTGTLIVAIENGEVLTAGYLDDQGDIQELDADQLATVVAVRSDGVPTTVVLGDLGEWRVMASTPPGSDTVIVTGLSMSDVGSAVGSYLITEAVVAGLGLLLAALAGTLLVRRELKPLERVSATATRISEQQLERGAVRLERVPEQDTDPATEVGQVGAALNRLIGHVESALAARHESETQVRQFVADASHELRTPLASIRGYAELVRRRPEGLPADALRAMERVESEGRRMTALVEDLLLLARLDAGRALARDEIDMVDLAVDAVADAHVAGRDHVWRLDLDGLGGDDDSTAEPEAATTVVLGDDHRLRQVLVNLLANARVHTPAGTTVTTSVRREADEVVLRVHDDGPGIAPELVPRLFQRFARGDASRSPGADREASAGSTGLGLAIVDAVVTAHRGRIEVDSGPGATTFTVHLPAVPA